jgi:hypothetical protein
MGRREIILVGVCVAVITCGIVWMMEQHQIITLRKALDDWGTKSE